MIQRPPRSTRTYTLFPYTTLFRSCIQGNFVPELIVWLGENYDKPESSAQVEKLQKFLTANMDVMHAAYPTIAKYFLCRRAVLRNSFSRQNGGVMDSGVRENMDHLFMAYQGLRKDLGI